MNLEERIREAIETTIDERTKEVERTQALLRDLLANPGSTQAQLAHHARRWLGMMRSRGGQTRVAIPVVDAWTTHLMDPDDDTHYEVRAEGEAIRVREYVSYASKDPKRRFDQDACRCTRDWCLDTGISSDREVHGYMYSILLINRATRASIDGSELFARRTDEGNRLRLYHEVRERLLTRHVFP